MGPAKKLCGTALASHSCTAEILLSILTTIKPVTGIGSFIKEIPAEKPRYFNIAEKN
jgi:hypothetical protein